MARGTARNVYLDKRQVEILESIAQAMGQGRIGIRPKRSQLIVKAVENFINDCRKRRKLRDAIEARESQLDKGRNKTGGRTAARLEVVQSKP
jgi:hypothetical protein